MYRGWLCPHTHGSLNILLCLPLLPPFLATSGYFQHQSSPRNLRFQEPPPTARACALSNKTTCQARVRTNSNPNSVPLCFSSFCFICLRNVHEWSTLKLNAAHRKAYTTIIITCYTQTVLAFPTAQTICYDLSLIHI